MPEIKKASMSGLFYPRNPDELKTVISFFKQSIIKYSDYSSRIVIVPHAGYIYSGKIAYEGINYLSKEAKNIFIFAPAHKVYVEGAVIANYDAWETPFGQIEVNKEILCELNRNFNLKCYNEAFFDEHAIEVQLPLLQTVMSDFKIVPILVGKENCENIEKIIAHYYANTENAFIISSDLSHFLTSDAAKKVDSISAKMIENADRKNFHPQQACGAVSVCAASEFAAKNNFSFIRVDMKNSGDITGDTDRVVGYGAWFLYEGTKNQYIKKYFSDFVIDVCKKSIENKGRYVPEDFAQVFVQEGASFVTLEKQGNLRGCIGSIIAHRPLIYDLIENAAASAYRDLRFKPVESNEIKDLEIKISLLSEPKEIEFSDEQELLNKIEPFKDGIIIKDGNFQAVYLPSVWEQLPNKTMFLNSLKQKAGLLPEHFSPDFEAYKFETEYI